MDAPVLHTLKVKYPKLFGDIYFECGPGWYNLLDKLASDLQPLIDKIPPLLDEDTGQISEYHYGCCVTQIKEKYGGLRFYMSSQTDEMSKLIDKAEYESFKICERCGDIGSLRGKGWVSVRCDGYYSAD